CASTTRRTPGTRTARRRGWRMSPLADPEAGRAPARSLSARWAHMPTNRWAKCPRCAAFIYHKRLEKNLKVCPECTHHFRLSATERIGFLLDAGSFQEMDANLTPGDPLGFVDSKPYSARIADNREKSGVSEAAMYGTGTIGGATALLLRPGVPFPG